MALTACVTYLVHVQVRSKAKAALLRYSKATLAALRGDTDEMLRGVDWAAVETFTDLGQELDKAFPGVHCLFPLSSDSVRRPNARVVLATCTAIRTSTGPEMPWIVPADDPHSMHS